VVHGLAGTGKSTVLAGIARRHSEALVVTPTGKSASVLRDRFGIGARTIHHVFHRVTSETIDDDSRRQPVFEPRHRAGSHQGVVLLIDEASMVSRELCEQLKRLGVIITAFGDPGQLPPVRGEPGFPEADVTLTEIHRQAADSPIIRQAHRVRSGRDYRSDGEAFQVIDKGSSDALRGADIVLCHTNRTRLFLNQHILRVQGFVTAPARHDGAFDPVTAYPRRFEPVVVLRNNRPHRVWNGDVKILAEPLRPGARVVSLFHDPNSGSAAFSDFPLASFEGMRGAGGARDGLELAFGHALTVHKAQGSEWPSVLIHDEFFGGDSERRAWRYTAITRATERVVIVTGGRPQR
jgi:exodeoxyribonuclease-5